MSTSLPSRSRTTAECTSRRELPRSTLFSLELPPSGGRKRQGCPSYLRVLVQGLLDAILSTGKRLERAQERYKGNFDKGVASVNRNLKVLEVTGVRLVRE